MTSFTSSLFARLANDLSLILLPVDPPSEEKHSNRGSEESKPAEAIHKLFILVFRFLLSFVGMNRFSQAGSCSIFGPRDCFEIRKLSNHHRDTESVKQLVDFTH